MYVFIIIFCILLISIYLSGGLTTLYEFVPTPGKDSHQLVANRIELIEFLTRNKKRVNKNYNTPPDHFMSSQYNTFGKISGEHVLVHYQFPLVERIKTQYSVKLFPDVVSAHIDSFGLYGGSVQYNGGELLVNIPTEQHEKMAFDRELYEGNWLLDKNGQLGLNYKKLVWDSLPFCMPIARHLQKELVISGKDNYLNRVQAALHFIQFLPYGQPNFDTENFCFGGLALPPESFVLNYSDCDSKSVFFAAILCNLIDPKNITMVLCEVSNKGSEPENHMMVGLRGLHFSSGQHVEYNGNSFLLLETTTPCVIGDWHWDAFECHKIEPLA